MSTLVGQLLDGLTGLDPVVLYVLAGLFLVLETTLFVGLLVPGDVVLLLAGSTVANPAAFALLVATTMLGSLTGESLGYLLGRRSGHRVRASRLGRRLGDHRWAKAEAFFDREGGRAAFTARFIPGISALVPVIAGTVGMPYRRFISWSAAGATVWSLLYVGIGAAAGASFRVYGDRLGTAGYALLALLIAGALLTRAIRRRRRRRASLDADPKKVRVRV